MTKPLTVHDAAEVEGLRPLASDLGREWAQSLAASLRVAGRRAAGGWPGTLTEARSRAEPLTPGTPFEARGDAREELARLLYAAARRHWLTLRDAEVVEQLGPPDLRGSDGEA